MENSPAVFDLLVITAANAAQAKGYREQIRWRRGRGLLPDGIRVLVVADPGGRRAGSLGATVNVLRKLGDLRGRNVFICHSGGDARRTPGYAAMGKAFTPLPLAGGTALFDLIFANMAKLPLPPGGGVLVACGDVLISFDFHLANLSSPGVTGIGYLDGAERASRHGVYEAGPQSRGPLRAVTGFLQKPKFTGGRHIVDTGIMWIDPATARKMAARRGWSKGDLYDDFTRALTGGFAPFHVYVARRCEFFHVGSSRELLRCMTAGSKTARRYGFDVGDPNLVGRDIFSASSENIVTGLPASLPGGVPATDAGSWAAILKKGECITFLPVGKSDWVEVRYFIDDNFKEDGKWEKPLFRLGGRKVSLKELMPMVNHRRMLEARRI